MRGGIASLASCFPCSGFGSKLRALQAQALLVPQDAGVQVLQALVSSGAALLRKALRPETRLTLHALAPVDERNSGSGESADGDEGEAGPARVA